jgi:hypothetical protein
MARKKAYTVQEVIEALEHGQGYVSQAAAYLGCAVQTIYNYRDRYPTVADAWDAIREKRHDFVENALMTQIKAGTVASTIFYLKTQAKDRGYVERVEQRISGEGGGPVYVVNWDEPRSDSD